MCTLLRRAENRPWTVFPVYTADVCMEMILQPRFHVRCSSEMASRWVWYEMRAKNRPRTAFPVYAANAGTRMFLQWRFQVRCSPEMTSSGGLV